MEFVCGSALARHFQHYCYHVQKTPDIGGIRTVVECVVANVSLMYAKGSTLERAMWPCRAPDLPPISKTSPRRRITDIQTKADEDSL